MTVKPKSDFITILYSYMLDALLTYINSKYILLILFFFFFSSFSAYIGPFRTISNSNTAIHFSLFNTAFMPKKSLIFFKYFSSISYHICRDLSLGLFLSVIFTLSEPSARYIVDIIYVTAYQHYYWHFKLYTLL